MKTKIRLSISAMAIFATLMATAQDAPENEVHSLDAYLITAATRTERSASTLPQTVDVLPSHEFADQLAISTDPIQGLAWLIPSYAPSRQKITGLGETLRGREPLFLIDGIPQSNPLRNGSRDGYTIDPIMIEQIEVINGASASQGLGATGGIINFVTRRAPSKDGVVHEFESGINSSSEFTGDGIGYRAAYATGARSGDVGVVGAVSYEWRGMSHDGDGRLIGVDNTQGDTQFSATWDLYGKIHYDLNAQQSITFFINHFNMEQELEYVQVPGNHALDIPTTSIRGTTEGRPARNEVTTAGLTYRHADLAGGNLTVDAFNQDFAATYGGGKFIDFQLDPTVPSTDYVFDQSQNESEKKGMRVTYAKTFRATGLVTGLDHLSDATRQILVHTGQVWVPETSQTSGNDSRVYAGRGQTFNLKFRAEF